MDNFPQDQTIHTYTQKKTLSARIKTIPTKYLLIGIGVVALISASISGVILVSNESQLQVPKFVANQELQAELTLAPTVEAEEQTIAQDAAEILRVTATPTPTATPSSTANWSTFQSQKYGYSFKFPPGWTAVRTSQSDPLILDYIVLNPVASPSGSAITFSYSSRTPAQALTIYNVQGTPILVNGIASTQKVIQNSNGNVTVQVIIPDGSNSAIWYAQSAYQNILNGILNTFALF